MLRATQISSLTLHLQLNLISGLISGFDTKCNSLWYLSVVSLPHPSPIRSWYVCIRLAVYCASTTGCRSLVSTQLLDHLGTGSARRCSSIGRLADRGSLNDQPLTRTSLPISLERSFGRINVRGLPVSSSSAPTPLSPGHSLSLSPAGRRSLYGVTAESPIRSTQCDENTARQFRALCFVAMALLDAQGCVTLIAPVPPSLKCREQLEVGGGALRCSKG
ncbi:hypothetical protein PR048_014015 [Dryococelus australis]|uniref:Uncharacterized protein n=1 Tax=Dryococelus australis TaxID=614101 RepID=A0ABQ9HUA0_9NEOP|nr:hypothetical protein PR048_014015 [Dryococelus australis]